MQQLHNMTENIIIYVQYLPPLYLTSQLNNSDPI